jgi:hypothetical protein
MVSTGKIPRAGQIGDYSMNLGGSAAGVDIIEMTSLDGAYAGSL